MHQDLHVESGVEAISGRPRLERASSLSLDVTRSGHAGGSFRQGIWDFGSLSSASAMKLACWTRCRADGFYTGRLRPAELTV